MLCPYDMKHCKEHYKTKVMPSLLRLLVALLPIGVLFLGARIFFGNNLYTAWAVEI